MKRNFLLVMLLVLVTCSACGTFSPASLGETSQNTSDTLTQAEKDKYIKVIAAFLQTHYWRYDAKHISFSGQVLNSNPDKNKILELSNDINLDMSDYLSKTLEVAALDLLYFNNEYAGVAYFYFDEETIVGAYYESVTGKQLSLKVRNVYLQDGLFEKFEDKDKISDFESFKISIEPLPISCINNSGNSCIISMIKDNSILFYRFANNRFSLFREFKPENNLTPLDIVYDENSNLYFILLGTTVDGDDENESFTQISKNIITLNANLLKVSSFETETQNATSLFLDDGFLGVTCGNSIYYYTISNSSLIKGSQLLLEHDALRVITSKLNLDTDQQFYIITSGLDFYVYIKDEHSLNLIFKTHIGIDSYDSFIYCSDLNNDLVNEIYLFDKNKTTIKYILEEISISSFNEEIELGERLYPGDFNNDGKFDYIKITDIEDSSVLLYLGQ